MLYEVITPFGGRGFGGAEYPGGGRAHHLLRITSYNVCYTKLLRWPEAGGLFLEHDNFAPANSLVTPEHIKPVWYFTPFYAILKAVPDKLMGVILRITSYNVCYTKLLRSRRTA